MLLFLAPPSFLLRGGHYFYPGSILYPECACVPTSSCTSVTRGKFWRREKGLAATREAGKATFSLEYGSLQPYSSAAGACSDPSSSPCLFSRQPDPAQPLDLQHCGDVLLGQNGLVLGQRANGSVLEQYLRKLVSGWGGLQTRSQGEVGVPWAPSRGTLVLEAAQRGALVGRGIEWARAQLHLISLVSRGETQTMSEGPSFRARWRERASAAETAAVVFPSVAVLPLPLPVAIHPSRVPRRGGARGRTCC